MNVLYRDLDGIEAVFLDLDGTLYLGDQLIEGALDFLARLEGSGIRRFFLSNNSSRSVDQYVEKLRGMGVPASAEDVLLSTHDLLSWLDSNGVSETYLVGTAGMQHMLEGAGVSYEAAASPSPAPRASSPAPSRPSPPSPSALRRARRRACRRRRGPPPRRPPRSPSPPSSSPPPPQTRPLKARR